MADRPETRAAHQLPQARKSPGNYRIGSGKAPPLSHGNESVSLVIKGSLLDYGSTTAANRATTARTPAMDDTAAWRLR